MDKQAVDTLVAELLKKISEAKFQQPVLDFSNLPNLMPFLFQPQEPFYNPIEVPMSGKQLKTCQHAEQTSNSPIVDTTMPKLVFGLPINSKQESGDSALAQEPLIVSANPEEDSVQSRKSSVQLDPESMNDMKNKSETIDHQDGINISVLECLDQDHLARNRHKRDPEWIGNIKMVTRSSPRDPLTEPPNPFEYIQLFYFPFPTRHKRADQYPSDFTTDQIAYCEDPFWIHRTVPIPEGTLVPPLPFDHALQMKMKEINELTAPEEDFTYEPNDNDPSPIPIPPGAIALYYERRNAHFKKLKEEGKTKGEPARKKRNIHQPSFREITPLTKKDME